MLVMVLLEVWAISALSISRTFGRDHFTAKGPKPACLQYQVHAVGMKPERPLNLISPCHPQHQHALLLSDIVFAVVREIQAESPYSGMWSLFLSATCLVTYG